MALFRPTYTRTKKDGTKVTKQATYWWGTYRDPSTDTIERVALKTRDKAAAKTILADKERKAALKAAGLLDPYDEHRRRPLTEHFDEFKKLLTDSGTTKKHARQVTNRAKRLADESGMKAWDDITASRVQAFIGKLKTDGYSIQTCNFYLQAIKQFCKWAVTDRRAAESPIASLKGQNVRTDRRHDRRALTIEEVERLLQAAIAGPERLGMTGPDRVMLYRLALDTGFRASELRSLTAISFDLETDPATVTVEAAYSKHRRQDTLPLRPELVEILKPWLATRDPGQPVFDMPDSHHVAEMLKGDLKDAGVPYKDESDHYADFHALRHTFITNLARGGVHPRVAQALARHMTITLTMDRYSHTVLGEQVEALKELPSLVVAQPEEDALEATGTDGVPEQERSESACTKLVRTGVAGSRRMATGGNRRGTKKSKRPRGRRGAKGPPSKHLALHGNDSRPGTGNENGGEAGIRSGRSSAQPRHERWRPEVTV